MSAAAADEFIESTRRVEDTFGQAMKVFIERNALRGDLWRSSGAQDHLDQLKSKVRRIQTMLENGMVDTDDIIDAMVYSAFILVAVEDGQLGRSDI